MSVLDWCAAAAGAWIVLACLGGTSWVLIANGLKRRRADVVRRPSYPPPVPHPPVKQEELDECWLEPWPTAASDTGEIRLRFDQILAAEGLA